MGACTSKKSQEKPSRENQTQKKLPSYKTGSCSSGRLERISNIRLNTQCKEPVLRMATQHDIRVDYELGETLGSGGFGVVRACRRVNNEGEEIGK